MPRIKTDTYRISSSLRIPPFEIREMELPYLFRGVWIPLRLTFYDDAVLQPTKFILANWRNPVGNIILNLEQMDHTQTQVLQSYTVTCTGLYSLHCGSCSSIDAADDNIVQACLSVIDVVVN